MPRTPAIREQIVSAISVVVHVRRYEDGVRRVESISEIRGLEGATPQMEEVFRFQRRERNGRRIIGDFVPTGAVPRLVGELAEREIEVATRIFHQRG